MDSSPLFHKDSRAIYRARPLEQFGWLLHGFGTRSSDFGTAANLATVRQVHSSTVVDAAGSVGCLGEGDALITDAPGILAGVKTADCFPIVLVDPSHRAVGVVHAGWRGTAAAIARRVVASMIERFGSRPEEMHAAIGPGIQECCFQVGAEVADRFGAPDGPPETNLHLDLAEINQRQLMESGLANSRIYNCSLCTVCEPDEFYSWRREKERAGRMLSVAGICCTNEGREPLF